MIPLALPASDLGALHRRVRALAEDRPAVYRMTDPAGRVLYVGKAKRLRARLLSYFHAAFPDDKSARVLHAAHHVAWEYVPSEFAACLAELREIRRHRPPMNVTYNRARTVTFITLAGGPAPRLGMSGNTTRADLRRYGPLPSPARVRDALRVLDDLLGLRDCAERMAIVFAGQGDLFASSAPSASSAPPALSAPPAPCLRHHLHTCLGPCAGLVDEETYRQRVAMAVAFLEGRAVAPLDRVVEEMSAASGGNDFERATWWRERFERLEWLFAALNRARSAIDLLSFVYRDPGDFGDDRAYLIRRGMVRAAFPWPATPIEREAFRGVVREELGRPDGAPGPLPPDTLDETLLLMSWFRRHPEALRRTEPLERWAEPGRDP